MSLFLMPLFVRGGGIPEQVNLSDEEIKKFLIERNIGYDFKKDKSTIPRMHKSKLHKLYNATIMSNNFGDISLIDPNNIPCHDLFTYSFPCTDISVSGLQQGFSKDSGTRSGLLWECQKVISVKKPKYLLMENVKNLVSKKFKDDFKLWIEWLENQSYTNYYKVLNAKDFGVPQNRERVFMVSILGEHTPYQFPLGDQLKISLQDVLEEEVDEKYYLKQSKIQRLINSFDFTKLFKANSIQIIGSTKTKISSRGQREVVYSSLGLIGTLLASDCTHSKQVAVIKNMVSEAVCV